MRLGKELVGKPIYSMTDGQQLGSVKDIFINQDLESVIGIYLGQEGIFSRKTLVILSKNVAVLGLDAVLVTDSDVVTDSNENPEVEGWLKRADLQGRGINTPGGTKVGTVGDILLDEEANIVGFSLARVHVEGPVAEHRIVHKEAVIDTGHKDGNMTIDLSRAEQMPGDVTDSIMPEEPAKPVADVEPGTLSDQVEPDESLENDSQ